MQPMTHRITQELARLRRDSHDRCAECGAPFKTGDTSHSGYDKAGRPLHVGDCCSRMLEETAVRNYFMPLPYELPEPTAVLWRYMSLAKLLALLKDRSLFFARADKLSDPFEGAKGIKRRKDLWDEHYLSFFEEDIRNPPEGHKCELTDDDIAKEARRLLQDLETGGATKRRKTFLSCWHEAEHESEALWRVYGGDAGQAIAVRTTFQKLRQALANDPDIEIGRV